MNGTMENGDVQLVSNEQCEVQYVSKPYKRRKTLPVDPNIIEIANPIKSDSLKVLTNSSDEFINLEKTPNANTIKATEKEPNDDVMKQETLREENVLDSSANYSVQNAENSITELDKCSVNLKKLQKSDSLDRLSPFSKMLIDPETCNKKKDPDEVSLDAPSLTQSPVSHSPPHSPISLASNHAPNSPICLASNIAKNYLGNSSFISNVADQISSLPPHANGISIYAEANARSKVCNPHLVLHKIKLDKEVAAQLVDQYSHLYNTSESEVAGNEATGIDSHNTEQKLKEFVQDYMLQKRYKDSGKAKVKKTPTLAELKEAKQKKKLQEKGDVSPGNVTPENVTPLDPTSIPAHSFGKAVILSESETDSVGAVDEESSQIEILEERPTTPTTVQSLKEAYDEEHRKRAIHTQPAHSSHSSRSHSIQHTYTFQRQPGHARTAALDMREPLPTMLQHKSHYPGIFNYITKEHDYCQYYHRPKDVEWHNHKHIISHKATDTQSADRQPEALSTATNLLLSVVPRPTYVMSEPWLFVPSIEDFRHEYDEYQQALGFETAMRQLLNVKEVPPVSGVQCAKCQIDFSCEWFTFMSKRLCKTCYKKEVKSRNSIIYMTNITHIARKAHIRAKHK